MLFNNMQKQEMWGMKEWIFPLLDGKSQCLNHAALSLFMKVLHWSTAKINVTGFCSFWVPENENDA